MSDDYYESIISNEQGSVFMIEGSESTTLIKMEIASLSYSF